MASEISRKVTKAALDARKWIQSNVKHAQTVLSAMRTAANFFPVIQLVLIVLAFFGKPLEFILLLVAGLVVTLLYAIYCIISLPPLIYIPYLLYYILLGVVPFVGFTVVWGAILVAVSVFCLLIALLDKLTAGRLKGMLLCQNSPAAWYSVPNFHLKNAFSRGLLCSRPCAVGYAPDSNTGLLCTKLPRGTPSYCAQAKVMQIFTGDELNASSSPLTYADFKTGASMPYLFSTPASREKRLMRHFEAQSKFTDACKVPMMPYNALTMSICSNLDDPNSKLTRVAKDRLKAACRQAFCSSSSTFPFCSDLSAARPVGRPSVLRRVIFIAVAIVVFPICLVGVFAAINR